MMNGLEEFVLPYEQREKLGFWMAAYKKLKPDKNDAKMDDWYTIHSMLMAWLMNMIEPSIRSTLLFYEDARELWVALKRILCVVNSTRIYQLKTSLAECKQCKMESVVSYFGRLSKIFDELSMYVVLAKCTCHGCTCSGCRCSLATQYQTPFAGRPSLMVSCWIRGAYASVQSQFLNQDFLGCAYQNITPQEERLCGGLKEDRETIGV